MHQTGFLYDQRYLDHDTGRGFPESSRRLAVTMQHLSAQPWFDSLVKIGPRAAERKWLETTHSSDFIDFAQASCAAGARMLGDPDVRVCESSYDVAVLAAGGALELIDRVMAGEISNGFALVRPPGHHAETTHAMGFCLFNSIAIAARYLQQQHNLEKVLILDWDVHHGNGTQHSFDEDPSVMFVSLHQFPYYPGTGAYSEKGTGKGKNYTLNCPMSAGATDFNYEKAFTQHILPAVNRFQPDAILVSAGFDAHSMDPLAQVNLSTEFFGWMTEKMMEVAEQHANGRLVSLLEGGYNLQALPLCVATHLRKLMSH